MKERNSWIQENKMKNWWPIGQWLRYYVICFDSLRWIYFPGSNLGRILSSVTLNSRPGRKGTCWPWTAYLSARSSGFLHQCFLKEVGSHNTTQYYRYTLSCLFKPQRRKKSHWIFHIQIRRMKIKCVLNEVKKNYFIFQRYNITLVPVTLLHIKTKLYSQHWSVSIWTLAFVMFM